MPPPPPPVMQQTPAPEPPHRAEPSDLDPSSPARGHRLRGRQPDPGRTGLGGYSPPLRSASRLGQRGDGRRSGARLRMVRRLDRGAGHEHGQGQHLRFRVPGRLAVRAGEPPARQLPGDPVRRHRVRWHQDGNGAATRRTFSGTRVDVGARAGFELFFGFIGIPELSLNATVGAQFSMRKSARTRSGLTNSDTTPRLLHHRPEQPLGHLRRQRRGPVLFLGTAMKSLFIVCASVACAIAASGCIERRRRVGHDPIDPFGSDGAGGSEPTIGTEPVTADGSGRARATIAALCAQACVRIQALCGSSADANCASECAADSPPNCEARVPGLPGRDVTTAPIVLQRRVHRAPTCSRAP